MEKVFLGVLAETADPKVILAVRGVLDFIYYAHLAVHTEESLRELDRAWLLFHENKNIFLHLGIRKHFNISKLHNIRHYVDMIRTHGTTDGYNTEGTERLHIDLAKMGYAASNKRQYIQQMTIWLTRQEAVHCFSRFLQWSIEGYNQPEAPADEDDKLVSQDGSQRDLHTPDGQQTKVVHCVAKKPGIAAMSVADAARAYGADDLLRHLNDFFCKNSYHSLATWNTDLALYNGATLWLPPICEVSEDPVKDRVVAVPGKSAKVTIHGIRPAVAPRFTTALIRTGPADKSKGPMEGVAIGQIRMIFRLTHQKSSFYESPLVYVRTCVS